MPYADVNDLKMYYEIHGCGPPLLLIMGLGASHEAWRLHLDELGEKYSCIVFDHRGVGLTRKRGTSARPLPPYSISQFADDTAGLLETLDLGPVHVCGVSMGGAIAMELAIRHPELIETLALHSTWHRTDGFLRNIFALRIPILESLGSAYLQYYVALWAWAPQYWDSEAAPGPLTATRSLVGRGTPDDWSQEECACYLGHLRAAIDHDASSRLHTISAPTLVVVGDNDILTHRRFADEMVAKIQGSQLQVVPGGGHAYCFESPATFRRIQSTWIERHR